MWSGEELNTDDIDYVFNTYPRIAEIQQCTIDFRKIYGEKKVDLLVQYIERYSASENVAIKSLASGLRSDIEAIKKFVVSELSNGYVEGNNNKIKAIKHTMYGRECPNARRIWSEKRRGNGSEVRLLSQSSSAC
jgi:transposase